MIIKTRIQANTFQLPRLCSYLFCFLIRCALKKSVRAIHSFTPTFLSFFFNTLCLSITTTKIIIPLLHPRNEKHLHRNLFEDRVSDFENHEKGQGAEAEQVGVDHNHAFQSLGQSEGCLRQKHNTVWSQHELQQPRRCCWQIRGSPQKLQCCHVTLRQRGFRGAYESGFCQNLGQQNRRRFGSETAGPGPGPSPAPFL